MFCHKMLKITPKRLKKRKPPCAMLKGVIDHLN
jgi:hypothetical protein